MKFEFPDGIAEFSQKKINDNLLARFGTSNCKSVLTSLAENQKFTKLVHSDKPDIDNTTYRSWASNIQKNSIATSSAEA